MMTENWNTSFLYGGNAPYVEGMYELYLTDIESVSSEWRSYFDALRKAPSVHGTDAADIPHAPIIDHFIEMSRRPRSFGMPGDQLLALAHKQVAVQSLITAYRQVGTRKAKLDPLRWTPTVSVPDLAPAFYGLGSADLSTQFSGADTNFLEENLKLADMVAALEETYCGTLGSEFMHLTDTNQRRWWQLRLESTKGKFTFSVEKQRHILERLTAAEGLEKYLGARYVGQKRFSLEGGESLIVMLDELVHHGAANGVRSVVMGMAHRGRLNVLVNIVGKPPAALFDEFDGKTVNLLPAGDVKYHKGFVGITKTVAGDVEVMLASNPSHLEIVNPVVQGITRARGEELAMGSGGDVLPIEIHGDAAISGQGIVMETMNLSNTRGYGTGGTIHVVVNNQVGFTTSDPRDTRSTFYCTDIAKMIEAPILHVNGDDPEAVVMAVQLAIEYRAAFNKSVVLDLVCFRRHGHQEQDTPSITQPMMYRAIAANPGVRTLYAQKLINENVVSTEQVESYAQAYRDRLDATQKAEEHSQAVEKARSGAPSRRQSMQQVYAAPEKSQLQAIAECITDIPDKYTLHPLVEKMLGGRRDMAAGKRAIDWGMGEHLAFASLLSEGVDIRLSGQDCERGTFTHRHAVLHNQNRINRSEGTYVPLHHVAPAQGRFSVTNSLLSEAAVLAFEYGYSSIRTDALVIWEAQFGDFANGAQVVIDQFIASGAAKWGQYSGVTMFLPHGQEGQGPEHASARLERYLQLCAQDNIQVCQPTTPAQLFHMLRQQAMPGDQRRPLVVMTPKSLLRHADAVSSFDELSAGSFHGVLGDASITEENAAKVEQVILCSGKVYYDLAAHRKAAQQPDVAIVRLERLYPVPEEELAAELMRYQNLKSVTWCQEEPENQGAWRFIESKLRDVIVSSANLKYAGRTELASTAPGFMSTHVEQQKALISSAFAR